MGVVRLQLLTELPELGERDHALHVGRAQSQQRETESLYTVLGWSYRYTFFKRDGERSYVLHLLFIVDEEALDLLVDV